MFTALKRFFVGIRTKEESMQLQEEFLRELEEAYTTYTIEPVRKYLHSDIPWTHLYTLELDAKAIGNHRLKI